MNVEDMMGCCGGFCGTCARSTSYTAFRGAAALLAELVDAHEFHQWMPDTVEFIIYMYSATPLYTGQITPCTLLRLQSHPLQ